MIDALPLLLGPEGYQISRSVRLRSSASANFSRTPASASNRRTFTLSCWVKRGALGSIQTFFSSISSAGVSTEFDFYFATDNSLQIGYGSANWRVTNALYRDTSAWYHIVLAVDTTQASDSNRILLYVNGVSQTFAVSNTVTQNTDTAVNMTYTHRIGGAPSYYGDMYMTEINFIDGQALTPTSFGQFNSVTGVWQPLKYTGTYGTNGFYLNFSDNSNNTATTIGKDYSGNGNNWTPNNISVTSGTTYDSMLDVPTPYADGGNGRGNYCVLNPIDVHTRATIVDGNLGITGATASKYAVGTIAVNSGKWYYEAQYTTAPSTNGGIGVATALDWPNMTDMDSSPSGIRYNPINGVIYKQGVSQGTFATYTNGDIIGVAFDCDNGAISFYKNNTLQTTLTGITALQNNSIAPVLYNYAGNMASNFGQRPFTYTPPSGYVALNTQNLPAPTISNGALYMAATTYTGNGGTLSVTNTVNGVSFQPDFVWVKNRSTAATDHILVDSVRGTNGTTYYRLFSDLTNAESANNSNSVSALNSNGFTVIGTSPNLDVNENGKALVGWQWQAGKGTTSSNTSGSITSTVSVNATAGFSVVTYTGTGASATVGHGLGVAPNMIIVKRRDGSANNWHVYHKNAAASPATGTLYLSLTDAFTVDSTEWNNTAPTSSVFTVGTQASVNGSGGTFVAYCFSAVAGYSAFGSYTGNGSATGDGPFIFTGFRPRWIMVKRTDSTGSWQIKDTARNPSNLADLTLFSNLSNAEYSTFYFYDLLSNGFKVRGTDAELNANGGTYVYAAFCESPFKLALAR